MNVTILLFAAHRELFGTDETRVDLPDAATVDDMITALRARGGAWEALPERPAVAVNRKYADRSTVLNEGDEVALIPPVAGG